MTLEREAEEYILRTYEEIPLVCIPDDPNMACLLMKYIQDTFKAGYLKARELQEWVSVEKDFPEFGVLVLVSFCGIVSYGRWDGFFWTVNDEPEYSLRKIDRIKHVTHWQPLPTPPKEQVNPEKEKGEVSEN